MYQTNPEQVWGDIFVFSVHLLWNTQFSPLWSDEENTFISSKKKLWRRLWIRLRDSWRTNAAVFWCSSASSCINSHPQREAGEEDVWMNKRENSPMEVKKSLWAEELVKRRMWISNQQRAIPPAPDTQNDSSDSISEFWQFYSSSDRRKDRIWLFELRRHLTSLI